MDTPITLFRHDFDLFRRYAAAASREDRETARRRLIGHVIRAWWRRDWAVAREMDAMIEEHNQTTRGVQITYCFG